MAELDFALVNAAFNGRSARGLRRTCQRDVAFAREQARGCVQADPAGTRQINLTPGVQIGEIHLGAAGAVEGLHVGFELNQIARDEACCQAQVAQHLYEQPAGVAA